MIRWDRTDWMYRRDIRKPIRREPCRVKRFLPRVDWGAFFRGGYRVEW